MEPFKEKKFIISLNYVLAFSAIMTVICFISLLTSDILFRASIIGFVVFFPLALLSLILHTLLETESAYTSKFISYINDKIQNATTLEEYIKIRNEFLELAVKDGMYNLSFPRSLKDIHGKLNVIIGSLQKLKTINDTLN